MNPPTDILIVGGDLLPELRAHARVRRVAFSFAGLAEAYNLIPECETVVVLPDVSIYDEMPTPTTVDWLSECTWRASMYKLAWSRSHLRTTSPEDAMRRGIAAIPKDKQQEFIRNIASYAMQAVLSLTVDLVRGGGTVYVLLPDDLPTMTEADSAPLTSFLLPVIGHFGDSPRWSARVHGEYAWLFDNSRSPLVFYLHQQLLATFGAALTTNRTVGHPAPVPIPSEIVSFLSAETSVSMQVGAIDRAGGWRALVLRWGRGCFVVAPAVCHQAVVTRLQPAGPSASVPIERPKKIRGIGRKPASPEERKKDAALFRRWESAKRASPGRLTVEEFAMDAELDPRVVRTTIDRHRHHAAAKRRAESRT